MNELLTSRIVLKPRRARPFFAGHPWVFHHSMAAVEGDPGPGDEVSVYSREGVFIARGLYNPASTIRVRLYRWSDDRLDDRFWRARLEAAVHLRVQTLNLPASTNTYRLVNSEGDGLSGLTVDRFDRWAVAQFSSLALLRRQAELLAPLAEIAGLDGLIARSDRGVAAEEGLDRQAVQLVGSLPAGPVTIEENGLLYEFELGAGQKTGFYCDQRENRRAVARYCAGRRVLDLFCFTGGFGLNARKHGPATSVLGIDGSTSAVAQARHDAERNGLADVSFETGDVFKALERLRQRDETFDVVICDPPKFAGQARDVDAALKGYRRLNRLAFGVLAPDGILATCSCSGLVGQDAFREAIALAAEEAGRSFQVLEQRGQAPDHPISAACPEGDYLKCLIGRAGLRP